MTRLGKLWTDAVAYVALVLGAGLSIAGNVADTYRTRGQATDVLDIVMAVAWPALVVLMVEIFVSPRWVGLAWPMQVLRWVGTLSIGGMAMRVSWVHLNDLMASRGQKADVAILGPLAIDALAIMATALILAGRRGHGHVATKRLATGAGGHVAMATGITEEDYVAIRNKLAKGGGQVAYTPAGWTGPVTSAADVATSEAAMRGQWPPAVPEPPVATQPIPDYNAWSRGHEEALVKAGDELATEIEQHLAKGTPALKVPVVPGQVNTLPHRRKMTGVPDGAVELLRAWWHGEGPTPPSRDVDQLLAGHFEVSPRTARRWRSAVLGPVSGPPDQR